jgi:hypothetical protein
MQLIRCVRAGVLSLLLLELLYTLPWPWSDAPQEVPLHPSRGKWNTCQHTIA